MTRNRIWVAWFGLFLASGAAYADPPTDPLIADRAMIEVASYATVDDFLALFEPQFPGTQVIDQVAGRAVFQLALPAGANPELVEAALDALVNPFPQNNDPNRPLAAADLLYAGRAPEGHTGSIYVSFTLNGELTFSEQYAGGVMALDDALSRSTGLGVAVAVLDTGIDPAHPALAGRVLSYGYNFVDNSTDTGDVGDGLDNDGDGEIDEMTGHGTYTAGLVRFVAPDAKLLPVVVLNSDGTSDNWILVKGMYYAIDHGVEVINMSLGSTYDSDVMFRALLAARSLGIPVVAAGGNQNTNARELEQHPATQDEAAFGVVSVDHDDVKSWFSNYNKRVLLCAPGGSLPDGSDPTGYDLTRSVIGPAPGGGYGVWEGTSMSTAFVSGAVALIRAQHPEWPPTAGAYTQTETLLAISADNVYSKNLPYWPERELGAGRLNVGAAVALGPVAPRLGDLDGDGDIDLSDLSRMLVDYGTVHSSADLDNSGLVDLADLSLLLVEFGT